MIKVSTTGMVVSLKTDLRFPIPRQQGHGGRIIHFEENSDMSLATTYTFPQFRTVSMVAEDIIPYGNKSEN